MGLCFFNFCLMGFCTFVAKQNQVVNGISVGNNFPLNYQYTYIMSSMNLESFDEFHINVRIPI